MDDKKLLKYCLEKGLLLDKEVLEMFSETKDLESVKLIIEKIRNHTQQRIITKNIFDSNKEQVVKFFSTLPEESQKSLEKFKIKLGLSIEISKEIMGPLPSKNVSFEIVNSSSDFEPLGEKTVLVKNCKTSTNKKLEVSDFVKYFKGRLSEMREILQEHSELNNLISIDKISGNRQGISIIGIVSDKRVTKNKNILLEVEDFTGKIRLLVNQNKPELYTKAEEIALDSVLGFKCSGSREILFVNDVIFPESRLFERKKSPVEEYALFIGDLHIGSNLFLEKNFLKFIDYLNGRLPNTPEVSKIKYLFVIGDLVSGVGVYPNQEAELILPNLEEQFEKVAELFGKIRRDIKIIISPGNHDGVRLMEPQPVLDERYAWPLYNLKNVFLATNPAQVNIGSKKEFSGFDVLLYHGFSLFYYAGNISYLMKAKAAHKPEMILSYLLKQRHLAPTHASVQYFPSEKDNHVIKKIPDIFVAGHTHKSSISYYNNILVISVSSWEKLTPYMEKLGSQPDFCKVPLLNLKTREIKMLDFE